MANLPSLLGLAVIVVACSLVSGEQTIDGETATNAELVDKEVAKPLQDYLRRRKRALNGAKGVTGRAMSERFPGISENIYARKQFAAAKQRAEGSGRNADHTGRRIANVRIRRQNANVEPGDWKDFFDKLMIAMNGAYGSGENTNSSEAGKTKRSTELKNGNVRVRRQNINVKPGDWKNVFDKMMIAMNGAYGSGENNNSSESGKTKRSAESKNRNIRVRRQNINVKPGDWKNVFDQMMIAMNGAYDSGENNNSTEAGKTKRSADLKNGKVRVRRQNINVKPGDWKNVFDKMMTAMNGAYGSGENNASSEAGKTKRSTGLENERVRRQNIDAKTVEWRDVFYMKGDSGNGEDQKSKRSINRGNIKIRNRRQDLHFKPHDWMDFWDALMIAMQGAVETKSIGVEVREGEGASKNSPEDSKMMWDTFVAAMKSAVRSWEKKEADAEAKTPSQKRDLKNDGPAELA